MVSTPEPDPNSETQRRDWLPLIVLAAIVAVLLSGWLLFPAIQAFVFNQDCTASGRTNCF